MAATGKNPAPPVGTRMPTRRKGCLIAATVAMTVVFLLIAMCAIRIRHPRFKGELASRIEMQAWQVESRENYQMSITDPAACRAIITVCKRGTWTMPHMCKARATFSIHYDDGAVDKVDYMPGHDGPDYCEIRMDMGHYRLSRKDFFRAMNDGGVDAAKIPVN